MATFAVLSRYLDGIVRRDVRARRAKLTEAAEAEAQPSLL
jgi:hypothetical protein